MEKSLFTSFIAAISFCSITALNAQSLNVDRTKYPDYTDKVNPDWSLMAPAHDAKATGMKRAAATQRPDHVNNAETRYFPPVFNQDGGSCGSASRICYMFSYELAAYRDLDGSKPENYYPSHFVWLHTNSPSSPIDQGKDAFVTKVGVPSAATYGGQTYSSLFGYQEESNNDFGWMQGYDKWFEAMHNRMLQPSNFPVSVKTEEGREAVKNWLWNHNGDPDFHAGGICGIGVASGGVWYDIPKTETNDKIGVTGMGYVREWGTSVDHALTVVGYDDRIEFDLDKDGIYGETNPEEVKDKETGKRIYTADIGEVGAWIIANSWGGWENGGFIYCPYAYAGPMFQNNGNPGNRTMLDNYWTPEIYRVRKDYRPLRTIKLLMDYSHRSEIALSAGISADLNATVPENMTNFVHFTYAGDGAYGNTNPAPEIPMLGRWADGKLHTEPMEFGYDLTDLTAGYDMNKPLKYFFIIDSRDWAKGKGTIHQASIIDYAYDRLGLETPFNVGEGVEIRNAGNKTVISVVVNGNSYRAPQNVVYTDGKLTWQAPVRSEKEVASYNIYYNDALHANVEATAYQTPDDILLGEFGVSALYEDGNESAKVAVRMPVAANPNVGVSLSQSGFSIPNIFKSKTQQATIEYWIKPVSLRDWNQSGGPGWGTFMFHANANGQFTAGWNTSDRIFTNTRLHVGVWTHVAIVVDGSLMRVYLDGKECGSFNSTNYSGLDGFGDLIFSSNGEQNAQNAVYDEIRIWNIARTEGQINASKDIEFVGSIMPQGLIAYLKGGVIEDEEGNSYLYDYIGGHNAQLHNDNYTIVNAGIPVIGTSSAQPTISINEPHTEVYAGIPVTFTATYNDAVCQLEWTAQDTKKIATTSPAITFATEGTYEISVTATSASGIEVTASRSINVKAAPDLDATFTSAVQTALAGERVTFHAANPHEGFLYHWSMPGSDNESAVSSSVATCYQASGTYNVTLTVTSPDGTSQSHTQQINVKKVAPKAAFSVTPTVVLKGAEVTLTDESHYAPAMWKWIINNGNNIHVVYDQNKRITMEEPGVYDITLNVANNVGSNKLTRERALIVANADSKNGLAFSADNAVVTASKVDIESAFTIEWWMNSNWPENDINGIGDSESTLLLKTMANGKIQLYIGGESVTTSEDYIVPGEWHHYAVTYDNGSIKFYRDGMQKETLEIVSATGIPSMFRFRIGGSGTPFKGSIDELRVWSNALTQEQLCTYANAPIADVASAESLYGLELYYDCNQSGGDVQDRTSNANHGVRTGFGPDGDAWGLSKGVFCLNFNETDKEDITAAYLANYAKEFTDNDTCVNTNLSQRTFGITGWTIENEITNGGITTGAHVDKGKSSCFTVTTEWDGFATTLNDHKVYQTITLAAGYYTFEAVYDDYFEGQCGNSYVVVAEGNTLPTKHTLDQAIAYTAMRAKGAAGSNTVSFLLTEETTVSVGLLINMSGKNCMALQRFSLTKTFVTIHEKVSTPLSSIDQVMNSYLYYVSQPHHGTGNVTAWAVQTGGTELKSSHDLSLTPDDSDVRQQFAFISDDNGITHYLYHPASEKFVGKDGRLSEYPIDAIYFKVGAFDSTFVAYFDDSHYVNVGGSRQMTIDTWSTADGGNSCQLLPVGEFDVTDALQRVTVGIINVAKGHLANEGTEVGNYTKESIHTLKAAIKSAEEAIANGTFNKVELQEAINGLEIILPSENKVYTIVSASNDDRGGKSIYVNDDGGMQFDEEDNVGKLFRFIPAGDNAYKMYHVERGLYLSTAKKANTGGQLAHAVTSEETVPVSIASMGVNGAVSITPENGDMIHAQVVGSVIVGWNDDSATGPSGWKLVAKETSLSEVLVHTLNVGDKGWASLVLGYDAQIPTGATVYIVPQIDGNYLSLQKIEGIVPAHTPVLVKAEQGSYAFAYDGTSGTTIENNLLEGYTYSSYHIPGEDVAYYVLANPSADKGMYKKTECDADRSNEDDDKDEQGNVTNARMDAITLKAYEAYLSLPDVSGDAPEALLFRDKGTTQLDNTRLTIAEGDGRVQVYDMMGRCITNHLRLKGIYLINGKKVVIR